MIFTEEETSNKLAELELQYDLFSFTLDDYCIWRLLKNDTSVSLQNLLFFNSKKKASKFLFILSKFIGLIKDIPLLFKITKKKYFVKTSSSVLREIENNKWKDVEFDYILKELNDCFKIEVKNNKSFNKRSKEALIPINLTTNTIDLLTLLFSRLLKINKIEHLADSFYLKIKNEKLLKNLDLIKIKRTLYNFYYSKFLYKILLKKVNPEYVLVSNTSEYSLIAAASELKIQSIEFQHGVFSSNHKDTFKDNALKYKKNIILPNKIFLFGKYWKNQFNSIRLYDDLLLVVGSPKIDYYRKKKQNFKKNSKKSYNILLTTQGFSTTELITFMNDFLNLTKNNLQYTLNIKLHPGYDSDKEKYLNSFLTCQNVNVIPSDENPNTFDLLLNADVHLSISSACHYDSLGLGIPTIILALKNYETVLDLYKNNFALLANSPNDLLFIIKTEKYKLLNRNIENFFYEPDSLKNIINLLQ
jgi:hypothetical protein